MFIWSERNEWLRCVDVSSSARHIIAHVMYYMSGTMSTTATASNLQQFSFFSLVFCVLMVFARISTSLSFDNVFIYIWFFVPEYRAHVEAIELDFIFIQFSGLHRCSRCSKRPNDTTKIRICRRFLSNFSQNINLVMIHLRCDSWNGWLRRKRPTLDAYVTNAIGRHPTHHKFNW